MKRVPFVPLSLDVAKKISKRSMGVGESLSKFFPSLSFELEQSGLELDSREWLAIAFHFSLIYFVFLFSGVLVITMIFKIVLVMGVLISFLVGLAAGFSVLLYLSFYPKLFVSRKVKSIERNLPHALHHLLIQVRSGVTLFDSLVSIARSNYGLLSKEFKRAVNEINTGKSEVSALEMLARENPSLYFRRILWQIINALKSGADIGSTIKEIVNNLVSEQKIAIKKYGAQLNPLALFYMVLVIIFPTLGIIFLLILFSFIGTVISIEFVLIGIIIFLTIFQFLFIGIIKSKRPVGV